MISVFWESFPVNLFNWEGDGFTVYLFALLTVLLTGIYALVYRYIQSKSIIKKQQLKWVVFSIIFGVLLGVGSNIFITFFEKTHPSQSASLIVNMAIQVISVLAQLSVPAAMVFSILRYRLYNVELVINRSLIYGALTVLLAILFGAILFGIQAIYQSITGETRPPTIGVILAVVVVGVTFQPARKALREFVNHRIYGMDVNFTEIKRQNKLKSRVSHKPYKDLTSIQGYKDLLLIARGGMGEVYRAQHLHLDRTVAIKVLSTYLQDDPLFNRRFAREAKAMSQLRHPNIINIFDYGDIDGLPYIVMEYLTGPTLTQLLADKERFTLDECLPLLKDIASALDHIHQLGLVHRDVKPSNIIVEPMTTINGKTQRAILMDFGIARNQNEDISLTIDGELLGTADYISPEQIHDEDDLDHRADIYSLGVMTYQLLTGKRPFERVNTWAMIRAHLEEPPPDAREILPFLSENTAKAIMKAMAKNPDERFSSAVKFIDELTT
jgi:tRNA A-37 threonylcarbamoyl transferase component Bud32